MQTHFEVLGFDHDSVMSLVGSISSGFNVSLTVVPDGLVVSGDDNSVGLFLAELGLIFGHRLVYGDLCELLIRRLRVRGLSISIAESYTGGRISSMITSVSGASAVFKGCVVAYSAESKRQILNVENDVITDYGVYSSECVIHMARGAMSLFGSDVSVATSGLSGPDTSSDNFMRYNPGMGFICILIKGRLPLTIEDDFSQPAHTHASAALQEHVAHASNHGPHHNVAIDPIPKWTSAQREHVILNSSLHAIKALLRHV